MTIFHKYRSNLLYVGVALSVFAAYKHTQICIDEVFPQLDTVMDPSDPVAFSAKSNYLQSSAGYIGIGK
jgi:hypothetical protein